MAQAGFTPIRLYSSTTPASTPSAANITNSAEGSEIAINVADGKLFYKDGSNVVQVIATKDAAAGTFTNATLTTPTITNALITGIRETITVSATAATGTINFDTLTQAVLYYTTNASGNWTLNVRGNSGTTLDSVMATGQSLSITFMVTQGGTAYYNNVLTIDGSAVTPKWQGGTAPTSGNTSSIDVYTYAIVKTASATFTVFASQTKFA